MLIAGVVLYAVWYRMQTSTSALVADIKSQMPPNPEAQPEPEGGQNPS